LAFDELVVASACANAESRSAHHGGKRAAAHAVADRALVPAARVLGERNGSVKPERGETSQRWRRSLAELGKGDGAPPATVGVAVCKAVPLPQPHWCLCLARSPVAPPGAHLGEIQKFSRFSVTSNLAAHA